MSCDTSQHFLFDSQNSTCVCILGYTLSDSQCIDTCGDGLVLTNECDDGNNLNGDGCSSTCQVEISYRCYNRSTNSSSVCVYEGIPLIVSLNSSRKTEGENQGFFQFSIYPPLLNINRMNLSSHVSFDCDSTYNVSDVAYSSGTLSIVTDYSEDMEERLCNFTFSYDPTVIRSNTSKITFSVDSDDT